MSFLPKTEQTGFHLHSTIIPTKDTDVAFTLSVKNVEVLYTHS